MLELLTALIITFSLNAAGPATKCAADPPAQSSVESPPVPGDGGDIIIKGG